jgi:hypothetical protein
MRRKLIILAILILPFSLLIVKLAAQETGQGLRLTPVSFDLNIDKGQTSTGTLHLDNNTGQTQEINVGIENFTAQGEQGEVTLTNEDSQYALAKWITVSPNHITIANNGRADFTYTIHVPEGAEPGGHFGSLVFSTVPPKSAGSTGAVVSQSVGSLFLVRVPGDVKENAVIESFKTDKPFYSNGPVNFIIRVKNNSSVHVKPIGVITITNELTGRKNVVGVAGENVLPGAIRQIPAQWEQKFLLGKYQAVANLNYGSKNLPVAYSTEFYAFPVGLGVIILIAVVFFIVFRKRLWRATKIIVKGK